MQFELSTGYKIWLTKLGKNKNWSLCVKKPDNDCFEVIGVIRNLDLFRECLMGKKND